MDYLFKEPDVTPALAHLFQIPDIQYNLYQIFLFSAIHTADFLGFGGLLYGVSKLLQLHTIDTMKTMFFFIFIFNTICLVSAVTDALRFVWKSEFFIYVHPLNDIVFIVYCAEFIREHAEITRWKSFMLSVVSLSVTLGVHTIFLG
jgi:hypothetical protein